MRGWILQKREGLQNGCVDLILSGFALPCDGVLIAEHTGVWTTEVRNKDRDIDMAHA